MDIFRVGGTPNTPNNTGGNNALDGITGQLAEKSGMKPEEIQRVIEDLHNVINSSASGTAPEMAGQAGGQGGPSLLESFRKSLDAEQDPGKKDEMMNLLDQGINTMRSTSNQVIDKAESTTTLSFGASNEKPLEF